jgi:hypothetical protein
VPRYFFHLHNDVDTLDDEGREFPDLESVRRAAQSDARQMAAESVMAGHLNLSHFIEVTDKSEQAVLRVTFGEVVTIIPESECGKQQERTIT